MRPFSFTKSGKLNSALSDKSTQSQFIAGGTNLVDLMKKNIAQPEGLIDVTSILSDKVEVKNNVLQIGAMVKNSTLATSKVVLERAPLIAKAVLMGASPQIRNMASTGGNLLQRTRCPYFYEVTAPCNKRNPGSGCGALSGEQKMNAIIGYSDTCVAVHPSDLCIALVALDATVQITEKSQKQITMPFKDFHRLPEKQAEKDNNLPADALITAITIPANPFAKNCAYVKLRDRDSYAFALVSVAAALALQGQKIVDVRLASGGVAHKPWRWVEAENFLKGKEATTANFQKAAEMVASSVKPLANNGFKVPLLKGAIETALQNALNG